MNLLQKTKKEFENLKKQEIQTIYTKMNLIRHEIAYGDFKDLARRTASDKILRDKAFNIAKIHKYHGYQRRLASMVYKVFDKKSSGSGVNMHANNKIKQNYQLAEELHRPIIKKLWKIKVYSGFKDKIWGADSADIQLISKFLDLDF